jgi:hypothetical protein
MQKTKFERSKMGCSRGARPALAVSSFSSSAVRAWRLGVGEPSLPILDRTVEGIAINIAANAGDMARVCTSAASS